MPQSGLRSWTVEADKAKTPNLVLRHIREVERRETREEFAAAVVNTGRQLGDHSLVSRS
jgi:hypothetical protein